MIKRKRKLNKLLIVHNVRLCVESEYGAAVYVDLLTGTQYGFADRRRLKLKFVERTVPYLRIHGYAHSVYEGLKRVSG